MSEPYGGYGTMPGDHLGLCPCGHRDAMCHRSNAARYCPTRENSKAFVSHEGMVTVYAADGSYLGCMGIERWERLLHEDRTASVSAGTNP